MENNADASEASKTVVNCEAVLDINSAKSLYAHFKEAIEHKHEVDINAEEVSRVDTSIMQIFTAFIFEAKTLEIPVEWTGVSENFFATAKLLGLEVELALPNPTKS